MGKLCMVRVSDVEPLMSIIPMLRGAGYDLVLPNRQLRDELRRLGCGNVDEIPDMQRRWGAEPKPADIDEVGPEVMDRADLYVDVNGNRNGPLVWQRWPNMKDKVLTYFINGGEPRKTEDKGDNQTPTTPMMTTAQHYRSTLFCPNKHWNVEAFSCDDPPLERGYWTNRELSHPQATVYDSGKGTEVGGWLCPHGCGPLQRAPWLGKVYVFYPMFTRQDRLLPRVSGSMDDKDHGVIKLPLHLDHPPGLYTEPVSFVHNSMSWGGQAWYPWAKPLGVKSYGGGNSPDGLIPHADCFRILSTALCTVYLKSGGAVDYSILEPMAMECPTTFHSSYVHNCRLYDLLEDGETCLMWNSEETMRACVERLRDPAENRRIGENGRKRMYEVTWNSSKQGEFNEFMQRNFK